MNFRFTDPSLEEIAKRQIPMEFAIETVVNPEQIVPERFGRKCYQSRKVFPNGRTYLVRVIVDKKDIPPTVRTVYATSKIAKYWRARMKVTYDQEVDILNIELTDNLIEESDEDKPGVILDYDSEGNVVGIEILDASKRMPIPITVEVAMVG